MVSVGHPYYKLDYIEQKWGSEKEQQEEIWAGNLDMKNWTTEVHKVVENTVSTFHLLPGFCMLTISAIDEGLLAEAAEGRGFPVEAPCPGMF